jgi:hypothetical protein
MVRFAIDEDMPRSTEKVLKEHGYDAKGDFLIYSGKRNRCEVDQPQSTQRAQSGAAFLCVLV